MAYRRIYKNSTGSKVEFLKVVERGRISLYLQVVNTSGYSGTTGSWYGSSSNQWYITKNSDTAKLLKTSALSIFMKSRGKRKNDLAELLMDNKEAYNKFIKDDKFSWEAIQNIVHFYNTGQELPITSEQ